MKGASGKGSRGDQEWPTLPRDSLARHASITISSIASVLSGGGQLGIHHFRSSRILIALAFLAAVPSVSSARADTGADTVADAVVGSHLLCESTQMGTPHYGGGLSIFSSQFLGARFRLTQPSTIDRVGGHIGGFPTNGNGKMFAALVALTGLD